MASRKTLPELFTKFGEDTVSRVLETSDLVEIKGENHRLIKFFQEIKGDDGGKV